MGVSAASVAAQAVNGGTRFVLAPQGNEARYRVREQLAGIDLPSDAVGKTTAVTGGIVVDANGAVVKDQSKFTIDLNTLVSDADRRDNYLRRNTLQTAEHAHALFVASELKGLGFRLAQSGDVTFQMSGDLTLRGVTRPVTWDVTAKVSNGSIQGEAKTKFTFAQFELTKPSVRSVLSVEDEIRLEY